MTIDVPTALPADFQVTVSDRRRPGRRDVAPQLTTLLRTLANDADVSGDLVRQFEGEEEPTIKLDPMAPARGIALGVALSIPIWGAIGGLVYTLWK
jgi:hypothetical protein